MKRFLLTLFVLLIVQTCAMAFDSSIKFIQVTDVHFVSKNPHNVEVLQKAIKDINKQSGVSFVVFTGDNIDNPKKEDIVQFMKIVKHLKVPYYIVIGNHDVYKSGGLSKAEYNAVVRNENKLWFHRSWNYTFRKKGYEFIVVDGAKEIIPGPVGYYRADTLKWLDKQLSKNKRRPVIIFQHYPILMSPDFGKRLRTHETYQAEKYFDVLNKHDNVLAIISGHFHTNSETMKDGIYHITTPTLHSEDGTYKIIDIVSKKGLSPIIYTQLKVVE